MLKLAYKYPEDYNKSVSRLDLLDTDKPNVVCYDIWVERSGITRPGFEERAVYQYVAYLGSDRDLAPYRGRFVLENGELVEVRGWELRRRAVSVS